MLRRLRIVFANIAGGGGNLSTQQHSLESQTHTTHGGQACIFLHVIRVVHTDISSTPHMLPVRYNTAIQGSGGTFLSWHFSCASLSLYSFLRILPHRHSISPPPPYILPLPPSFIQCCGKHTTLCPRRSRCGLDHLGLMSAASPRFCSSNGCIIVPCFQKKSKETREATGSITDCSSRAFSHPTAWRRLNRRSSF